MTTHTIKPKPDQQAMQPLKPIPEPPAVPAMAAPVRVCNAASAGIYTGAGLGYRGKA